MSLLIKICGLGDARQVLAAAAAGADAAGFVFAESVRRVTPQHARDISAALPSGVKRVAVMRHPTNDEWQEVLRVFAPDVLQTDAEDFATLDVPARIERWPVYREGQGLPAPATTYVYEGSVSGSGKTVNWTAAARLATNGHMILAGGLNPGNVAAAIATVRPLGVDVSSGVERAPGEKDRRMINEFIMAARAAEKTV